jgi:hypothetical protein
MRLQTRTNERAQSLAFVETGMLAPELLNSAC